MRWTWPFCSDQWTEIPNFYQDSLAQGRAARGIYLIGCRLSIRFHEDVPPQWYSGVIDAANGAAANGAACWCEYKLAQERQRRLLRLIGGRVSVARNKRTVAHGESASVVWAVPRLDKGEADPTLA